MNNPSGAVIKGTVTTHRPIQADRHVLSTVTFTAGTTNVTVPSGTTRALTAGHYGATQVSAGGTLSLSAGTYYMASLTVGSDATLVLDETAGAVVIYVQSTFTFAGKEAESGGDGHVLVAIFGCEPDVLSAPFRGTVSAQNASLSLTAATFEGKFLAEGIELGPKAAVTGLTTMAPTPAQSQATSPVTTTVPTRPQSHATSPLALVPLPAPPPPVEGCYQYTGSAWQNVPCATDAFIDQHFPHPDAQLSLVSYAAPSLVYGLLTVNILAVGSESNAFLASTSNITQ